MKVEFYKTKETVEQYIKSAKGFNGKLLIDKLKGVLSYNLKVLEIGSGPGTDWDILKENYNVVGSDNSNEFLNHLKLKYPLGEFLELDATSLETDIKFDGIYTNKVLHHLKSAELSNSIKRQSEILRPKGIICHSFWSGEGEEIFKGLLVNYHNKAQLKKLFENYFDILSIETYEEFEDGDSVLLIGRKK